MRVQHGVARESLWYAFNKSTTMPTSSVKYASYLEIKRFVWFSADNVSNSLTEDYFWRSISSWFYGKLSFIFVLVLYHKLNMFFMQEKALGVLIKAEALMILNLQRRGCFWKPQIEVNNFFDSDLGQEGQFFSFSHYNEQMYTVHTSKDIYFKTFMDKKICHRYI